MYQTIEVFCGIKMSVEEAEGIKDDYFNSGKECTLFEFLIEAEPGKDAPVWFSEDHDDVDIVFGISTGYLFEVVDRWSMPGIEEIVFNNAGDTSFSVYLDLVKFIGDLGLKDHIRLYVVNSW